MTDSTNGLVIAAVVWLVMLAAIGLISLRAGAPSAGLVCAYALGLWLIHWPGAAIYLLPWYPGVDEPVVETGFLQSAYAIVAFGIGSLLFGPMLLSLLGLRQQFWSVSSDDGDRPRTVNPTAYARAYFGLGLLCYFTLGAVVGRVPTLTALVSTGWNLMIVGIGLSCWNAWRQGRGSHLLGWLLLGAGLPFLTILGQGYLTYGSAAALAVLSMVATFYRPRWRLVLAGVLVFYAAFSLYVTYMRDRHAIRDVVWGDQPAAARLGQMAVTLSNLEIFDPFNEQHLTLIDDRLNQNRLDGAAVAYLDAGFADFARGDTIWQAVSALVPRAMWADKPVAAGSPGLVSHFTGIHFDPNTSIGIGHVMEFYVNFGTVGVIAGFTLLGMVLSVVDRAAARRLRTQDWAGFAVWFLPGFNLVQVGGSLVELSASVGAALVTAVLVNLVLRQVLPRE